MLMWKKLAYELKKYIEHFVWIQSEKFWYKQKHQTANGSKRTKWPDFHVKNVLQSTDLCAFFLPGSVFCSLPSSQSFPFTLLIEIVTWFDFAGIFKNVEQEPERKLYWQLGNWMFLYQGNEISSSLGNFLLLLPFQMVDGGAKKRRNINKWMLDGALEIYRRKNEELYNAENCISKRCAWMTNFSLRLPLYNPSTDTLTHCPRWSTWGTRNYVYKDDAQLECKIGQKLQESEMEAERERERKIAENDIDEKANWELTRWDLDTLLCTTMWPLCVKHVSNLCALANETCNFIEISLQTFHSSLISEKKIINFSTKHCRLIWTWVLNATWDMSQKLCRWMQ